MKFAEFSIKRPILVTSIFILIIFAGLLSYNKLSVDLYPDVSFPIVVVNTIYPGAGPQEIEQLVTKPIEKELSTLSGISSVKSTNKEGISVVIAEFTLDTDVRFAEQQVKDRVSSIRTWLPQDIQEPTIKNFDPAEQPILVLSMTAELGDADLFDLADEEIMPLLNQVKQVGNVVIIGGRKREIHVNLNRNKLREYRISATQVSNQLALSGRNVPAGKIESPLKETVIRTLGEFETLDSIRNTIISFYGNESSVKVGDIATVTDSLADLKSKNYVNGSPSLSLMVLRQSGANTIKVAQDVKKRIEKINSEFEKRIPGFHLTVNRDGSKPIKANVDDVIETIFIGILLVILVVFFFLGNARSTLITGIAIPNSLIGALILMAAMGFSINIMTLLAMSLAVGLLIDDAIVVRENIFRHIEMGKSALKASVEGTHEVMYAVLGVSLTILAVFGPIAFLDGLVGQFFKEFGLTVCFIILISTADALIMAPMMSTYFAGPLHKVRRNFLSKGIGWLVDKFDNFQSWLEVKYEQSLDWTLKFKKTTLLASLAISIGAIGVASFVPKTFTPPQDTGQFVVGLDMKAGTSLKAMDEVTMAMDKEIRAISQVQKTVVTVGGQNGEPNEAQIFINLVPKSERDENTSKMKDYVREKIASKYSQANPKVLDDGGMGGAQQPFHVSIVGNNLSDIKQVATQLFDKLKTNSDLKDVNISYRDGKPELQVKVLKEKADEFGVSSTTIGQELRTLIEGSTPAVYRKNSKEYDIRVRLEEKDRNLEENYNKTFVPNINSKLIRLSDVSEPLRVEGPATIYRQDRGRYIQVTADINADGKGLAAAMAEVRRLFSSDEIKTPPGIRYEFVGSAENFQELAESMILAIVLALVLIFLVLASLYESFITPITIMSVIPLAACGAIYALAIAGSTLDIFSIIGCILLLGVATKNSIILIDYIEQLIAGGLKNNEAIVKACVIRLRPILMTACAIIAGMVPLAIGLNEASSQRTSMGIAVIGGTFTSTLLTLFVIPAVYTYMQTFGKFINRMAFSVLSKPDDTELKDL